MSATPGGLTYALGALAVGASQSVTIVVVPKVPGMLFNLAVATRVGPDPDSSNNYAEVSVTVHQAPTVVSLERLGYHTGPTTRALRFSAPLDAATAVDVRNTGCARCTGAAIGRRSGSARRPTTRRAERWC
jgi:hypothetical protein